MLARVHLGGGKLTCVCMVPFPWLHIVHTHTHTHTHSRSHTHTHTHTHTHMEEQTGDMRSPPSPETGRWFQNLLPPLLPPLLLLPPAGPEPQQ